ncbi:MAG: LPS assembly lipoprotein LptE [Burkholderiaceae bacterium]
MTSSAQSPGRRSTLHRLIGVTGLSTVAALSACGFKLRQSVDLPFATLFNGLGSGGLSNEFSRQIRVAAATRLVTNQSDADATIKLLTENRQKEAVSFSTSGRPREYELRYVVKFRVRDREGVEVLRPTEIELRRYITTTDVELLAEELEEEFLYREMQTDMVQQILRRLAAIDRPL